MYAKVSGSISLSHEPSHDQWSSYASRPRGTGLSLWTELRAKTALTRADEHDAVAQCPEVVWIDGSHLGVFFAEVKCEEKGWCNVDEVVEWSLRHRRQRIHSTAALPVSLHLWRFTLPLHGGQRRGFVYALSALQDVVALSISIRDEVRYGFAERLPEQAHGPSRQFLVVFFPSTCSFLYVLQDRSA